MCPVDIADSYHIGSKHSEKIYVSRFIVCVCVCVGGGGRGGGGGVYVCVYMLGIGMYEGLPGPRLNIHNNMQLLTIS